MDKRAAELYLNKVFGNGQGHVAVAYKDKGQSWQECQFEWPTDRTKLLGWAEVHSDANVFICPALRNDAHTRKKNDSKPTRWLWADVDWQSVPEDKKADVLARIAEVGTMHVRSGTGANVHVYVELTTPVDHHDFIKLNTGLRDYLYADNKQADNSLLRLPGTTNWKTDGGSPVEMYGGNGKRTTKANLMKRRAFRDAKVIADADATEWDFVQVEGLPRRIKAMVEMDVAQAEAKYGSRYKAVWAITGELHKRGMGPDEIHSLMDKFPPALSKAADENGYDVHRDVDKRIAWDRAKAPVVEDDDVDDDAGDMFEEMSAEQVMEALVAEGVEKELLRRAVRKAADRAEATRGWIEPPATVSRSLSDALRTPPEPEPFLIQGMAQARGNIVLTAQYKSGKTDLLLGTLARSLADGTPFLDHFEVFTPEGGMKVGHWNLEMDEGFLIDEYVRPSGYGNTDNLVIASLRGYRVNILTEVGRAWTVAWLKDNEIKVWTIDSIAQLARMASVSENANEEMGQLLGAVDEIKQEAGVDACFLIAHTGRAQQEEGKERARAATIIDDWPDSRWVMTVDGSDVRYLQVQGRGTDLKSTSLNYDKETHRYTMGGMSKTEAAADGWVQTVVRILMNEAPKPLTDSSLRSKMKELGRIGNDAALQVIKEAEESGFTIRKREKGPRGPHVWNNYPVTGPPPDDRRMNATPREVNLAVGPRGGRRRSSS